MGYAVPLRSRALDIELTAGHRDERLTVRRVMDKGEIV
jgi:hypothetical protein